MDWIRGIHKFNEERGLLKEFNVTTEYNMLKEEIEELIDSNSSEEAIDALCDIVVLAIGGMLKLGYRPNDAMRETAKEILSRKGKMGPDGKWIKTGDGSYKADYERCIQYAEKI